MGFNKIKEGNTHTFPRVLLPDFDDPNNVIESLVSSRIVDCVSHDLMNDFEGNKSLSLSSICLISFFWVKS